jgi:hypothetical protein
LQSIGINLGQLTAQALFLTLYTHDIMSPSLYFIIMGCIAIGFGLYIHFFMPEDEPD